jgi:anti-sigma regulatory factor (Ser/Thr protein kinase)
MRYKHDHPREWCELRQTLNTTEEEQFKQWLKDRGFGLEDIQTAMELEELFEQWRLQRE